VVNLDSTGIFRGYQKYEYRFAEEDNNLCKYFADGRLFYVLDIQGNKAYGEHLCGLDLYQAEYSFIDEENFLLEYKTKGPNKDYKIFTMYKRRW